MYALPSDMPAAYFFFFLLPLEESFVGMPLPAYYHFYLPFHVATHLAEWGHSMWHYVCDAQMWVQQRFLLPPGGGLSLRLSFIMLSDHRA